MSLETALNSRVINLTVDSTSPLNRPADFSNFTLTWFLLRKPAPPTVVLTPVSGDSLLPGAQPEYLKQTNNTFACFISRASNWSLFALAPSSLFPRSRQRDLS